MSDENMTIKFRSWLEHEAERTKVETDNGDLDGQDDGQTLDLILSAVAIHGEEASDADCIDEIESIIHAWRTKEASSS